MVVQRDRFGSSHAVVLGTASGVPVGSNSHVTV